MANFCSNEVDIHYPAISVFKKLSNLEGLKNILSNVPSSQIPEDKREMLNQIEVSADSISLPAGPVGSLTLKLDRLIEPSLIQLKGENSPVPIMVSIKINPVSSSECRACVEVSLEIPAMLKPMVSGPLNKLMEQFAAMIAMIPYGNSVDD